MITWKTFINKDFEPWTFIGILVFSCKSLLIGVDAYFKISKIQDFYYKQCWFFFKVPGIFSMQRNSKQNGYSVSIHVYLHCNVNSNISNSFSIHITNSK